MAEILDPSCELHDILPVNRVSRLSKADFLQVVKRAPLVSLDVVLRDEADRVLLGLRCNEPAKGYWFVPGGRILKAEKIKNTFQRVLLSEIGIKGLRFGEAVGIGVFEHFYDSNFAGEPGVLTHYVSIGYLLRLGETQETRGDEQHSQLKWFSLKRALRDPRVHPYTKELIAASQRASRKLP
jgi:colanic acid biosynthesis protein WcaH